MYKILCFLLFLGVFLNSCLEKNKEIENLKIPKNVNYEKGEKLSDNGQHDSSYFYFNKAKQDFLITKDSLNIAKSIIYMGINQWDLGDHYGAQETSLEAIKYLDTLNVDKRKLYSHLYNTVANAADDLKQYEEAIPYYRLAIQFTKDSAHVMMIKNNLAVCLRNAEKYQESIALSNDILKHTAKGTKNYAKYLNNLAKTKWAAFTNYNPIAAYQTALQIRIKENDLWGQNSSYATLAKYYQTINLDSSIYYLKKQYQIAKIINSADDQLNALKGLIQSSSLGTQNYAPIYIQLNDSVQLARNHAKNQFALIRYDSEKNKINSLRLEKENEQKESHLFLQRIGIGFLLFLMCLLGWVGILWYKKREQRLELISQNKIKENQLHLSKKIHDVVANGIYRVMAEIEHHEDIDREDILDKLDDMYHKSRDISHDVEQNPEQNETYTSQIADLLKSFANDDRKILIAGNEEQQWLNVDNHMKNEIKHVLQELMVNMKKYSQANQVVIRFGFNSENRTIFYKDNGIGFQNEKKKGKGILNTVSRIESLGGQIIFDSKLNGGLNVIITLPTV